MTKLSAAWATRFGEAAKDLREQGPTEDVHPRLHKATVDALEELSSELLALSKKLR